jgi:lysozyme
MSWLRFGCSRADLASLVVIAGLAGCSAPIRREPIGHSLQAVTVCASGSVVQGVDVSVYQGTIQWSDVKTAGIDFAIARISDGSELDTEFAANWAGMQSAGLVRGAYQYFEPGEDPTTQANIVVSAVGKLGAGDLPVTADMETTGGQSAATIAANLRTWIAAVQAGTGKLPMIYTAEGYWDGDVASGAFSNDSLWVANWEVSCPDLPTGWSAWSVWQYSDSGTVSGISGAVDLDEFNGTLAELQSFAGGSSPTPDAGANVYYAAAFVSQSWPLATTALAMTTCQTQTASITLKNVGATPWDTHTRLATTRPRDRKSLFADSTWITDDRPAAVTGTVAPGDTFEFKFDFRAPPTAGNYQEYFGLVEDSSGVWFSAPGQGGPPDNDIEANIDVTENGMTCTDDPGVPDGSAIGLVDGGQTGADAGSPPTDAGSFAPETGVVLGSDAGQGPPGLADTAAFGGGNGCACSSAGRPSSPMSPPWVWALGAVAWARLRRKRARADSRRILLPSPADANVAVGGLCADR